MLIIGLIVLLLQSVILADFVANRCLSCEQLAKKIQSGLEKTSTIDRKIMIGRRIGPNGETVPSKVVDYLDSEDRLHEVLENACDGNKKKNECYTLLDDFEEEINSWFFNKRSESFLEAICFSRVQNCDKAKLQQYFTEDLKRQMKETMDKVKSTKPAESTESAKPAESVESVKEPIKIESAQVKKIFFELKGKFEQALGLLRNDRLYLVGTISVLIVLIGVSLNIMLGGKPRLPNKKIKSKKN